MGEQMKEIYDLLKSRCGGITYQAAGDPYKRIWKLTGDEAKECGKAQMLGQGYIPQSQPIQSCAVCLKGFPNSKMNPFPEKGGGKCSSCKKITYCSKECQKADYKRHKEHCVKT
jgi:hypothetical protein